MVHLHAYMTLNMHVSCLAYMTYVPKLVGIFLFGTYLAITCKVETEVACVLAYICKIGGSVFPFSMLSL